LPPKPHPAPPQGIDIYDTKFNIVSPGADVDIYFPFSDHERRLTSLHTDLKVGAGAGAASACVWLGRAGGAGARGRARADRPRRRPASRRPPAARPPLPLAPPETWRSPPQSPLTPLPPPSYRPQELVWGSGEAPVAVSTLEDPSKPVLFSMARLDRVKNLTGVVDW
jgi:hypothetical protein